MKDKRSSMRAHSVILTWMDFVGMTEPKFASQAFFAYLDLCGLTIVEKK